MEISWLHLTDWHVGQTGQPERFPALEAKLFEDLNRTLKNIGSLDLVFFTGDLVNQGNPTEFEQLEEKLIKIWDFLSASGHHPKLVSVPGNHDLVRPDRFSPVALALKDWTNNPELRSEFWGVKGEILRNQLTSCFDGYANWKKSSTIPMLEGIEGALPGDYLGKFEKDGISVGILGLNSTYLQYNGDNCEGKLWLSPRQIPQPSGVSFVEYLNNCHIRLLLTHHPESWLDKNAHSGFRGDIAPSGLFDLHLCGHLHSAHAQTNETGNGPKRVQRQGISFFGLETFGEGDAQESRKHGYSLGRWLISNDGIMETIWPREAVKKQDGGWGITPDPTSYLDENGAATRAIRHAPGNETQNIAAAESSAFNFFSRVDSNLISSFPTLSISFGRSHQSIWKDERVRFQGLLANTPVTSIVTDWAFGSDEFISSSIFGEEVPALLRKIAESSRVYILRCDGLEEVDNFESFFKQQFGVTLHDFCQACADFDWALLICDGIQPELFYGKSGERIRSLLGIVAELSPNLKVVITSRAEIGGGLPSITLKSLDAPETRAFVEAHEQCREDLLTIDAIEKIHFASGGLPTQIDQLLNRLEFASLDTILEEGLLADSDASLHGALERCIKRLQIDDGSGEDSRSWHLLKALSVLSFGATLDSIKRFDPPRPFRASHVEQLIRLNLIEALPIHYDVGGGFSRDPTKQYSSLSPKILRAPKQVRDCVFSLLSDDDTKALANLASEFIFGAKWRSGGAIKLRKLPVQYREYLNGGLGNEYAVIRLLLAISHNQKGTAGLKSSLNLALHYCGVLKSADRNKDLREISSAILHLIEESNFDTEKRQLHGLCGRACRLCGAYTEGASHFQAAKELWDGPRGEQYGRILLELAICLRANDDAALAKEVLEEAKVYAKHNTLFESQVSAQLDRLSETAKMEKTKLAENNARIQKWTSHANDLALILAANSSKEREKIDAYDRVINSGEEGRNRYRAVVSKGKVLRNSGNLSKLTLTDQVCLRKAYQYFHAQRSSEFAGCHAVIWEFLQERGQIDALYSLFWHSSFIWRIEGNIEAEREYAEKLAKAQDQPSKDIESRLVIEISYFKKRMQALVVRLIPSKAGRVPSS